MPETVTTPVCENCNVREEDCTCPRCVRCDVVSDYICEGCNRCRTHCDQLDECMDCEGCGNRVRSESCINCGDCSLCCNCVGCSSCASQVYPEDICDRCRNCNSCGCECTYHVPRLKSKGLFHTSKLNQYVHNQSKRYVSCELEVYSVNNDKEGIGIYNTCKKWGAGIVSDGSLPESGFEINTAPANGDLFINQIKEISASLKKAKSSAKEDCCGYHVHIDARDFSYWEIRRLIKLYALIEDALFSIVPEKRRINSQYCRPCGRQYLRIVENGFSPKECKAKVTEAVYKTKDTRLNHNGRWASAETYRRHKYHDSRYNALNLHSWYFRGTIECRLASGTINATEIINWALLWAGILDWVYTHTDKDIVPLEKLSSWEALKTVTPTSKIITWIEAQKKQFDKSDNDD